ncbi:MAG: hypothetical protein LRY41_03580 [Candidatus Pacebacteria bacterium]|nr:hypothetical protein [Candidatus Paceibacterota bacterium]MCD8508358.1 hypothetical protein [Candidatus Paceibacterota bacterium]MCD8528371.1 hypothetical protein [Candidatus Paceibacterota bacterium]MCD8563670.1 hypothetical protein [Candidatus Paceibacterota bacterium]
METVTLSCKQALDIMGSKQFIGPKDIENTFGFMPNTIPEISFSVEELERGRELGQQLILYIDTKRDGTPFTVSNIHNIISGVTSDGKNLLYDKTHIAEDLVLATQTPRLGWRLTTPEVIDNSTNKNYLQQTETLIKYLQNVHYKEVVMPQAFKEAICEFNTINTSEIREKIMSLETPKWQEVARMLSGLSINELTRERSSEVIYRWVINEKKLGVKNLSLSYTWSNSLNKVGGLVFIGLFDGNLFDSYWKGLRAKTWRPRGFHSNVGVCFSVGAL